MSLGFTKTLLFKLTFWYGAVTAVLVGAAFISLYRTLETVLINDLDRELTAEMMEWQSVYDQTGVEGIELEFVSEAIAFGPLRCYCTLLAPDGKVLASSDISQWPPLSLPDPPAGAPTISTVTLEEWPAPIRMITKQETNTGGTFQFGIVADEHKGLMAHIRDVSIVCVLLTSLLGGGLGYMLSRRAIAGMATLTAAINDAGTGDLSRRVHELPDEPEIRNLVIAFNRMQEQVERTLNELRNISGDIAHDMRSPLTRIRGIAEMAIVSNGTKEEAMEALGIAVEECDHMLTLTDILLRICRLDAGIVDYQPEACDLDQVVRSVADAFSPVAEDKQIVLSLSLTDKVTMTNVHCHDLQRVIANLLDNAIKFTPSGGIIKLGLVTDKNHTTLTVADSGIGIPEAERAKIFNRFYRLDSSRSTRGNGLGLSLVQAIVRAYKGTIVVRDNTPSGIVFEVCLPLTRETTEELAPMA